MEISLQAQNKPLLTFVVLSNIAAYLAALNKGFAVEDWIEMFTSIQELVPALVGSILTGIINAQINSNNKERLVFWKWSHPLPGCRAFTEHLDTDSRIDKDALQKYQAPLPTDPDKQNALWYKWYKEFEDAPAVKQANRKYLFTRDYAGISFVLIISFGPLALWQMASVGIAGIYFSILLAQYLLVRQAARNHGVRLVTSVLAHKASSDQQGRESL